jgi:DNA-binding CsgD family transcriptional regulator
MERLTQSDFSALLDFLRSNYVARDLPEFRRFVITALPDVVRSEITGYNEIDLRKWRDEHILFPMERMDFPDSFELFNEHIREHPVINHLARTQRPEILRISDFLTHRQFARTGLYQDFFRQVGTRDQISVTLKVGKRTIVGIALNHSQDYTERHRTLLSLVRPHLIQAYRNALFISRMKEELEAARQSLEHVNAAAITLGPSGHASSIAPFAEKLLEKYFGSRPRVNGLPLAVRDWMKEQRARVDELRPAQPLVMSLNGSQLEIRLLSQNGQTVLLLNEKIMPSRPAMIPEALAATSLSPREAEVLAWVARGRTNSEIAQILRLSARTIQKHVEHIFQKLGVETRTSAAAQAWEVAAQNTSTYGR